MKSRQTCAADWTKCSAFATSGLRRSGVLFTTISGFEAGKSGLQLYTAEALRKALEAGGVQFLDVGAVASGPGVAIKGDALFAEFTEANLSI